MSYLHSVHFSLDEANDLLQEIKPLVEEMIGLKIKLDEKGYDIFNHSYFGGSGPNGSGAFPVELEKLVEIIKIISSRGVQIKGIDNGLIDFPYIRENGEEVYLCWKYGEDDISYWHTIPGGYSERRNINEL
jgi:hypothetical protein